MPWKELAQIYLDQKNNFLLAHKKFWAVSENEIKFQQFFIGWLLKIILKVFLFILVDHIIERLPAVLSFQMES